MNNNERCYGLDALRALCMYMVVIVHFIGHGGVLSVGEPNSINLNIAWLIYIASNCAVNCFAIISGYVGLSSKYSYTNIILLWIRVVFYDILIFLSFNIFNNNVFSIKEVLMLFFPIKNDTHWYFTSYFGLFLFIPLLNFIVDQLEHKKLKITLILIFLFYSFVQSIYRKEILGTNSGYSSFWLILLYLLGAYIRKYGFLNRIKNKNIYILLYFITILITWFGKVLSNLDIYNFSQFVGYISPTMILAAVFLLMYFKSVKINNVTVKILKFITPLVFSIYIIHDSLYIREEFIWYKFTWITSLPVYLEIIVILLIPLSIWIICLIIDIIREGIFKILKIKQILLKIEKRLVKNIE